MARSGNAQMLQFPFTASKPACNLPERMGSAQLTEKHGHKLIPARISFRMAFSMSPRNKILKLDARKQLQQLAKYATKSIHRRPSFCDETFLAEILYHKSDSGPILFQYLSWTRVTLISNAGNLFRRTCGRLG